MGPPRNFRSLNPNIRCHFCASQGTRPRIPRKLLKMRNGDERQPLEPLHHTPDIPTLGKAGDSGANPTNQPQFELELRISLLSGPIDDLRLRKSEAPAAKRVVVDLKSNKHRDCLLTCHSALSLTSQTPLPPWASLTVFSREVKDPQW